MSDPKFITHKNCVLCDAPFTVKRSHAHLVICCSPECSRAHRSRIRRPILHVIGPSICYVPLTKGQFALIDLEDAADVSRFNWFAFLAPLNGSYYANHQIRRPDGKQRTEALHTFILHTPKGMTGDHVIPSRTLDNRRQNLRIANQSQQCTNQRLQRNNTSGHRGVHHVKASGKWHAYLILHKKRIHLGIFETLQLAVAARSEAAQRAFGDFAADHIRETV